MVVIRLELPAPFDFRNPDDWQRSKRRFEQFPIASGHETDDASKQTNTLFYTLGEEVESVQSSINVTDKERKHYDTV